MTHDETIVIGLLPENEYMTIVNEALRYSLISIAFTYNRMGKNDIERRVVNIVKGKIAEGVFYNYCSKLGTKIDSTSCATPFWLPDMRDFIYLGGEWDIKNNFITCDDKIFKSMDFGQLPALIPHKNENDQWSKREKTYLPNTRFAAYLFTFMRLRKGDRSFFNIKLLDSQWQFVNDLVVNHAYRPTKEMPFLESWFFEKLTSLNNDSWINLHYQPEMLITGCANARYWSLFKLLPENQIFSHGMLKTIIPNMGVEVALLPSFQQVLKAN
jgi:hypothetical protein